MVRGGGAGCGSATGAGPVAGFGASFGRSMLRVSCCWPLAQGVSRKVVLPRASVQR